MDIVGSIIVFIVLWCLSFFMVLPVRMRSQEEVDVIASNTQPGVPAEPKLFMRMGWATGLAVFFWAIFFVVLEYGLISISDLNWLS